MDKLEFRRITLSIQGTMASTREYEILKKPNGMEASLYDGGWRFNKLETRRSCRIGHGTWGQKEYREFTALLEEAVYGPKEY